MQVTERPIPLQKVRIAKKVPMSTKNLHINQSRSSQNFKALGSNLIKQSFNSNDENTVTISRNKVGDSRINGNTNGNNNNITSNSSVNL
jgi:hypothetical protein